MTKKFVKYFNSDALKFIERGNFQFGTLAKYRSQEAQVFNRTRFSDTQEGVIQKRIIGSDVQIDELKSGNSSLRDVRIRGFDTAVFDEVSINEYVFCASIGEYSKRHHETMLFGYGEYYFGNEDLLFFAQIDLNKFLKGLEQVAPSHQSYQCTSPKEYYILGGPVVYDKKPETLLAEMHGKKYDFSIDPLDYEKAVLHKPEYFYPENEYRFIYRPFAPNTLPDNIYTPISFESSALMNAIDFFGQIYRDY